jgi:SAM-dependent methyltransferase
VGADGVAAYYDRYWTDAGFQPPPNGNAFLEEQIARFGRPGVSIADLGCGDARTVGDRLESSGASYVGVDVSPSAVEAATSRGLDVRLIEDIASSGLDAGSFDAVFIIEVVEHLMDPLSAVHEARQLLRPGGSLLVTCPNAAVWIRRAELLFLGRPNAMGDELSRSEPWRDPHIRSFTPSTLEAMIRLAGFDHVTVGGTEPSFPVKAWGSALARRRPSLFARRCTAIAVAP